MNWIAIYAWLAVNDIAVWSILVGSFLVFGILIIITGSYKKKILHICSIAALVVDMICMFVIPTSSTPKDLDSQKIIATQKSNQYYTIKSYPVKKYRGKTVIDRNPKRGSFFGGKLYKNTFENGWITDDDGNYNADINGSIKVLTDNNKQYKVKNEYTYITNKKTTDPHKKYSMKVITADVKSDIKDRNIKEFAKENNIKAAVFITIYHYQKPVHWKNIN